MDAKTIKRILYGVVAGVLFLLAGREVRAAGLTPEAGLAGGAGLILLFSAATGKG
jgi:hypothetical protein